MLSHLGVVVVMMAMDVVAVVVVVVVLELSDSHHDVHAGRGDQGEPELREEHSAARVRLLEDELHLGHEQVQRERDEGAGGDREEEVLNLRSLPHVQLEDEEDSEAAREGRRKFHVSRLTVEKPAARSTMKSPSSCGISCTATASVAALPAAVPADHEKPRVTPSTRLCSSSTRRFAMP